MKSIYEITIPDPISETNVLFMPNGAKILSVRAQPTNLGTIHLSILSDDEATSVKRVIHVFPLFGAVPHPMSAFPYVGAVLIPHGGALYHVFDGGEP